MFARQHDDHWLAREIRLKWKRVLKRIDMTSRSLVTLIEPGSCFAGTLAELIFAADRSYMLIGTDARATTARPPRSSSATPTLRPLSDEQRPLAPRDALPRRARVRSTPRATRIGKPLDAERGRASASSPFALDDIDWEDEVRLFLEERASFSPDGLTGMEANLRFAGPETMETKIFARLTAWQNWIFQRPNAVGPGGRADALRLGAEAEFRFEESVTLMVRSAAKLRVSNRMARDAERRGRPSSTAAAPPPQDEEKM